MNYRNTLKEKERIVVKIGTSSLSFPNGRINYARLEKLSMVLSDIRSSGKEVVLVSSGAVGIGAARLKMDSPPDALVPRQALASIGQAELIRIYQKFFDEYNQMVAQVLLTRDGLDNEQRRNNATNTINELLLMKVIPIINENDTVSTVEVRFGDNDNLSAKVSVMLKADMLILLTNMDGLYTADPEHHPDAERISVVEEINQELESVIYQSSTAFGKGGMFSKLNAAGLCMNNHIDVAIINGNDPKNLYRLIEGKDIGTLFISPQVKK